MSVKVAINGFGRIGRLAFRQMFGAEGYEVVAINDLTSAKMLAHLLKYDSTQGNYVAQGHTVDFHEGEGEDNYIVVDGKKIVIYKMPNAADLPWGQLGVDVVLECTGFYTSKAKAQAHIDAGARKVVISAPAGNDLPTIVFNVNHKTLTKEDNIISAASCTTNCLAPMAKALNDLAPIESGIMCTIHAYTGDQMPLDGPQRKGDLRRSRAAAVNIVPNSTGAAKAIGLVIPELNGKLIGAAQRVPTPSPSATTPTRSFPPTSSACASVPCSMPPRPWSCPCRTATPRFRSFPGTTMRTPTPARWSAPSSTSPSWANSHTATRQALLRQRLFFRLCAVDRSRLICYDKSTKVNFRRCEDEATFCVPAGLCAAVRLFCLQTAQQFQNGIPCFLLDLLLALLSDFRL